MIIAQISDTHILANSSDDDLAAKRADNLRRCVADINRQAVDAVIHTGDSVHHGTADEYAHLSEILSELRAPLFLTPGNRDRHDGIRTAFNDLRYFPRRGHFLHYAIEDYPVRLVALDSVSAGERKGVFCKQRLAWLDVRKEAMDVYNEGIQKAIEAVTVWQASCNHYYASASGRIVTQYPHSMTTFKNEARGVDPSVFEVGALAESVSVV